MKYVPAIALCLSCIFIAVACGTESSSTSTGAKDGMTSDAEATDTSADAKASMTFGTWNVGLAYNFVSLATGRMPEVAKAVAASKDDVLCLQEVWTDADLAAIETAAKTAGYTDVYINKTPEDTAGLAAACTEGDSKELGPCSIKNCSKAVNLVGCVQDKCKAQLAAISDNCLTCLASNLSLSIEKILDKCSKGGAKYSWGGYNGLMLLSRKPLTNKKHTFFDASLVRRSVLTAEIEGPGKTKIKLACTHLTAGLESLNYPGTAGSWKKEQAAQVKKMMTMLGTDGTTVILGDLNTSLKKGKVTGEYEENYKLFTAAGYVDPFMDVADPLCTFCADNTLVKNAADSGGENATLDHILVRGWTGGLVASRTFEAKVTVQDKNGKSNVTNLSDHYGVQVRFEVK